MIKNSWYSKAKILGIERVTPIQRIVTGVKKENQGYYESSPYLHGSNGTYGEHVNSYFGITFRVYQIDPSHPELTPEVFTHDIDKYIRENLMKRFGWEKMTENRLSLLNQKLNGHKLKVITWDMEKWPIYRNYVPYDYENKWECFLDYMFHDLYTE